MIGFGVASLLTSMVTKSAGSARLIVSDNCGFWLLGDGSKTAGTAMGTKDLAETTTASNNARTCYGADNQTAGLQCNLFTKKTLPYTTDPDSACPFGDNICNTTAFSLDTNRLSSQDDFGLNTPKFSRVDFRKITTCAPLNQAGYVAKTTAPGTEGIGAKGDVIRHYSYGGWNGVPGVENDTWLYNQHAFVDNFGYQFESIIHLAGEENVAWQLIDALKMDDADTTVMFLALNAIQFTKPNNDPFFHANFEIPMTILGQDATFWLSGEWVNMMACTDQYQFCNPLLPDSQACTPLAGSHDAINVISKIQLNPVQEMTATIIYYNLRQTSIYYSIFNRGAGAPRAQEIVNLLAQAPIPDDQWQIEVTSWFDTALAKLQRSVTSFAAGPEHVTKGSHIQPPTSEIGKSMCYSQKVAVTSDTVSFSVLGMAVILAVGVLVIGIWLVLESLVGWVQRRYDWSDYRRLRWIMDDKMQLQRMAFEETGMGNWSKLSSNVPVTEKGQVFGGLRHVDPEEPRLGERWAVGEKGGLAAAAAATTNVSFDVHGGRLSVMGSVGEENNAKKNGLSVYERPVYQAVTPPGSQGGC